MNIKELLDKQRELDRLIHERAGIKKYPLQSIKLALLVELGELANEVQSFKYWKQHKNIVRERVLEEFADCFHFALSLENELKQTDKDLLDTIENDMSDILELIINDSEEESITDEFELAYKYVLDEQDILLAIIALGLILGISLSEMEAAYLKKYEENIRRQQQGY